MATSLIHPDRIQTLTSEDIEPRAGAFVLVMRMYWGKQILRWAASPERAFATALDLNNRHFLDGRDCSSYANIAWLLGLHDQAFGERPVSGKTRVMTRGGLDRKLDVSAWLGDVRARLGDAAVDGPDGESSSVGLD